MAVKYTVTIEGAQKTPFVSGAKQRSMRAFANYVWALISGAFSPSGASMTVRNAGVKASQTVVFSGAASAADTVTVNGQALTATQKNATGTITFAAVPAVDDTVTINGSVLTAKAGCARASAIFATIVADNVLTVNGTAFTAKVAPGSNVQFALGANDTDAVNNCVAKINAHPTISLIIEAAADTGGADKTVLLKARASGTAGNAYTLTATGVPITVSGALFEDGVALTNAQFDIGDTLTQAARQCKEAINASTDRLINQYVDATSSAGIVTVRALDAGTAGNAIAMEDDGADITAEANLSNGAAASNNAWDPGNSAATAAEAFKDAVNASTTGKVSYLVTATHNGSGTVTLTSSLPGYAGNMYTLVKSGSNIAVTGAALTGGSESAPFSFEF